MLSRAFKTTPTGASSHFLPAHSTKVASLPSPQGSPVGSFCEDAMFTDDIACSPPDYIAQPVQTLYTQNPEPSNEQSALFEVEPESDMSDALTCRMVEKKDGRSAAVPFPFPSSSLTSATDLHRLASIGEHQMVLGWDPATTSLPSISSLLATAEGASGHPCRCLSSEGMSALTEEWNARLMSRQSSSGRDSQKPFNMDRARSVPISISKTQIPSPDELPGTHNLLNFSNETLRLKPAVSRSKTQDGTSAPARKPFRPPHEIIAASFAGCTNPSMGSLSRHKSIADRLKSVVFEQTGHMPHYTAQGFLNQET